MRKSKAGKKTAKKSAKAKKATKAKMSRSDSKAEKVLDLMKRKEGATLAEIARRPTGKITAFADSSAGT